MYDVSESTLIVLMFVGAVFAFAGLYLLLKPPKSDGETRVEAFGIKLNASSGGVVVFIVGAFFLAAPVFVPKTASTESIPGLQNTGGELTDSAPGDESVALIPPRQKVKDKEAEPNDNYDQANQINVGDSIAGFVSQASPDWIAILVDPNKPLVYIKIRNTGTDWTGCDIEFRNLEEQDIFPMASFNYPDVNTARTWEAPINGTTAIFVWLSARFSGGCRYELFTSYGPH